MSPATKKSITRFLSNRALRRKPSAIRSLQPLTQLPGMISLAGGMPNPETFPIASMTMKLKSGEEIEVENLSKGLQYSPTAGLNSLTEWVLNLQREVHSSRNQSYSDDWSVLVTNGSQSALSKCFEAILNEDDVLLTENPTYSGALAALDPIGCEKVGCEVDAEGIIPQKLRETLEKLKQEGKTVKALYTVPTGCNPSGSTLTVERKREIYKMATEYDFLILEDDPYYYLNYGSKEGDSLGANESFLSMDSEGRVVRFDSFSKIVSAGLRVGFASGNKELIHYLNLHQQATELHASGIAQLLLHSLLDKWGISGFENHVNYVKQFYRKRRDFTVQCIDRYLSEDVDYFLPTAGMFIWMKLKNVQDSKALIEQKARDAKILLVPGEAFHPNGESGPYVRAAFSVASEEEIDTAFQRLADILKEERKEKV